MTINEFVNKYNLHDSLLENITYDETTKKIVLSIDFCYWQQDDYKDDMDETGMIVIEFDEVESLKYVPYQINSDEIVDISHEDNRITLTVFNDISNDNIDIIINAKNVTVSKCDWKEKETCYEYI